LEGSSVPVRRAVSQLDRSQGVPPELADYGEGFQAMRELDSTNPMGLEYQAAIHSFSDPNPPFEDWNWCQHQNWFFLPWHRMYLRQLEKIICHLIGKPDWRLPYWDYTGPDEATWSLPPEFLEPADDSNPLWVEGRLRDALTEDRRDATAALAATQFEIPGPAGWGFGSGRVETPTNFGGLLGAVEGTPHNVGHTGIGGLLADPDTAALDPIFWLHHASIDHLWEVWLRQDDPQRENPSDSVWLDTEFSFPDPESRMTYRIRDVLDTASIGYVYDDAAPPPVEERGRAIVTEAFMGESVEPELVGESEEQVPLAPGERHAVNLQSPSDWGIVGRAREAGALDEGRPVEEAATELALDRRVILQLERVTGSDAPYGVYGVYVNVPEGDDLADHPELKAGLFSPFGLARATAEGEGVTQSYDITEIARRLYAEGQWNPERVHVAFDADVPTAAAAEDSQATEARARDPKVGSIRVYVE
jgi:Common central domain of tyrosinase/Polyphenol oxidase middle domain